MMDKEKKGKLSYSQFLEALQKIQDQALSGSEKELSLFSNVIYSLMPDELAYGKYKPLGQLIFKLDREFMPLFSTNYKSKKYQLDKMADSVTDVLSTISFIVQKLSSGKGVDNQAIIEVLDILNTRMKKMRELKVQNFTFVGNNITLKEKLNKLDLLKKEIVKYLGLESVDDEESFLKSVRRELFVGGASLLGLIENLSKGKNAENPMEHIRIFSDKKIQFQFKEVVLSIIQKGIRGYNFLLKGLGEDLENLINRGIISEKLWGLYYENSDLSKTQITKHHCTNKAIEPEAAIVHERYQIVNLIEWSKVRISNIIGLPYLNSCRYVIDQYQQCAHLLNNELEMLNEKMVKIYSSDEIGKDLREHLRLLKKHSLQVFSSEYTQRMGKSLKDREEVLKYQNSKKQLDLLKSKTKNLTSLLEHPDQFDKQIKNMVRLEEYIVILETELDKFISSLELHLNTNIPKNLKQLLSDKDHDSISVQLENIILRCIKSVEDFSFTTTPYSPICHSDYKLMSSQNVEEMSLSLDKLIPLFKRPVGSLSVEQTFPEDVENYLDCETFEDFRIKLRDLMEYLNTQKLKSRQLSMLTFPAMGAGGYDKFTNTMVIPCFDSPQKENIYFALSDYIYTTMMKARGDSSLEPLCLALKDKFKMVSLRKHRDIVIIKVLTSIVIEMTAKNKPSGLSDKIISNFIRFLDPPNDLIIFRDVVNVPPLKRDSYLADILEKYNISNTKSFLLGLKTFLIEQYNHPELVKEKTNPALVLMVADLELNQRLKIYDDIYDAGVILFDKAMVKESFVLFYALLEIGSKESAVLWNIATIINFHKFSGIEGIVKSPKQFCINCYQMFEKTTALSEYWKMKARKIRLGLGG